MTVEGGEAARLLLAAAQQAPDSVAHGAVTVALDSVAPVYGPAGLLFRRAAGGRGDAALAAGIRSCLAASLPALVERAAAALTGTAPVSVSAWAGVLAAASPAQVTALLLPAFAKALKARPDALLPLVTEVVAICGSAGAEAEKCWADVVAPAALSQAIASKDEGRPGAFAAAEGLGRSAGCDAACARVVSGVRDTLTKGRTSVPLWSSRLGAVRLLQAVGSGLATRAGPVSAGAVKLAAEASELVLAVVPKEGDERVRAGAVTALGPFLALQLRTGAALAPEVAAFFAAGLKACVGASEDGFAEALYVASRGGLQPADGGEVSPAADAVCKALGHSTAVVDGLYSVVVGRASAALALGAKKAAAAPGPAVFALATLLRLARFDATLVEKLGHQRISAESGAPASVPAGKAAAAKGGKAVVAPPALPSGGKAYDVWDLFTSPALSFATVLAPSLLSATGRSVTDVASLSSITYAASDALFTALSSFPSSLEPYSRTHLTGVYADLLGASAGNVREDKAAARAAVEAGAEAAKTAVPVAAGKGSAPSSAAAEATAPTPGKTRAPGALFVALVSLLSHPVASVRRVACGRLQSVYGAQAHSQLPACLLHALWDRIKGLDACAPRMAVCSAPWDTGVGDGPIAAAALAKVVAGNGWKMPGLVPAGEGAGEEFPALPAAHTLQAAFVSILGEKGTESALAGLLGVPVDATLLPPSAAGAEVPAAALLLPVSLLLSSHPCVGGLGPAGDPTVRSRTGAANAAGVGGTLWASIEHASVGGRGDDGAGRNARSLWRRAHAALVAASGPAPPASGCTVAIGGTGAIVSLPLSPVDSLLALDVVGSAITAHALGYAGVWAPVLGTPGGVSAAHSLRTCTGRALRLLCSEWSGTHVSKRALASAAILPPCSAGRLVVLKSVLPALLSALADTVTGVISTVDVSIWAEGREGVLWTPPAGQPGEGAYGPEAALRSRPVPAFVPRGLRSRPGRAAVAGSEDEPWMGTLAAQVEEARRRGVEEAAAKAAMDRVKEGGKAGALKLTVAGPDGFGAGGGGGGGCGRAAAASGRVEDPAIVALREQGATRMRVQEAYQQAVAALFALQGMVAGFGTDVGTQVEGGAGALSLAAAPGLLTTLLPALGHPLTADHARSVVRSLVASALFGTVACPNPSSGPYEGVAEDWARCLQTVQVSAVTRESMLRALSKGTDGLGGGRVAAGIVPPDAYEEDGDALGASGFDMTGVTGPLRRLLTLLLPRCAPNSGHSLGGAGGGYQGESALETAGFDMSAGGPVRTSLRTGPLPTTAFVLLFPVLRAVLTSSPPLALAQPALAVLAPHIAPSPALTASPGALMAALASGRLAMGGKPAVSLPQASLAVVQGTAAIAGGEGGEGAVGATSVHLRLVVPLNASVADGSSVAVISAFGLPDAADGPLASATKATMLAALPALPSAVDEASAPAMYLLHRALAEPLSSTVLHVLRTSPRAMPSPDALLLELARGEGEHVGAAGGDDADVSPALRTLALGAAGPLLGEQGLLSPFGHIRAACLSALDAILTVHAPPAPAALKSLCVEGVAPTPVARIVDTLLVRLYLVCNDDDEDAAAYAQSLWDRHACVLPAGAFPSLCSLLSYPDDATRAAAGRAIAASIKARPASVDGALKVLVARFAAYADVSVAAVPGAANTRAAIFSSLADAARRGCVPVTHVPTLLPFILGKGLADSVLSVRTTALGAGRALVDAYGASHTRLLLPALEGLLEAGASSPLAAPTELRRDSQREGAVVLLGAVAAHLHPETSALEAAKVKAILKTLVETLDTPSEPVQVAVSNVLPPLVRMARADSLALVSGLLMKLTKGEGYAARRGAAFGLAGAVRGLGLPSLKTHGILRAIEEAAGDAKSERAREGALFACEALCTGLGFLIEPFVTRILPLLLRATGDGSADVREASGTASKAAMRVLTGYGVKLIMPAVLGGLAELSWRSKTASIQLLGHTSFVSPKQLGALLPTIVPELAKAFDDPHPRVQEAGRHALADIGKVIKNEEVQNLVPALLGAIADPDRTREALVALAATAFAHAMDPASLALVMPVLRRGLTDRTTAVKTSACTIAGAIVTLVGEPADLMPYLPGILPPLQKAVGDPIPDVRGAASGALGGLARGLGLERLPELLPWLVSRLSEDSSTVERSGAAQGLTEILVALGEPTLSATLSTLLPLADAPKPSPREGLLWLTVFLPPTLGIAGFAPLLPRLFPVVVGGLADDTEGVRDVAARAGAVIVKRHARSDGRALLPALEAGTRCPSWRIRKESVAMIGNLLAEVAGVRLAAAVVAGNTVEDDEGGEDDWASEDGDGEGGQSLEAEEAAAGEAIAAAAAAAEAAADVKSGTKAEKDREARANEAAETAAAFLAAKKEARTEPGEKDTDKGATKGGAAAADPDAPLKRRKGERGRPEDALPLPARQKSQKLRQPTEAKLRALAAAEAAEGAGGAPEPSGRRRHKAAVEEEVDEDDEDVIRWGGHVYRLSAMDAVTQAHARLLGWEGRCRAMACVYLARSDTSGVVRQGALAVWKVLVPNAPKALREILPALVPMLIDLLSGSGAEAGATSGVLDVSTGVALPGVALRDSSGMHGEERRLVAGRCLGDVVRKLGDRVLPDVIPILRDGVRPPVYAPGFAEAHPEVVARDAARRRGVCLGLGEVIDAAGRIMIGSYLPAILPAVLEALCDGNASVREAAKETFTTLQRVVGRPALDAILPNLLTAIDSTDEGTRTAALAGLAGVVAVRPRDVLPVVLDRLLTPPLRTLQARALAAVAAVTGGTVLHGHMSTLLPIMVRCIAGTEESAPAPVAATGGWKKGGPAVAVPVLAALPPLSAEETAANAAIAAAEDPLTARLAGPKGAALCAVMGSVSGPHAVSWTLHELVKASGDSNATHRRAAFALLQALLSRVTYTDWAAQVPMLLKELINRGSETAAGALKGAWEALSTLLSSLPPEELGQHVDLARSLLSSLNSEARYRRGGVGGSSSYHLPGLCLPKGLDGVLPIYLRALMHGTPGERETAALALGEVIDLTSPEGLKPYFIKLTGPLIRVVADKWPWGVKAAILGTLGKLLTVGGAALKPFQPQLQSSFVKALVDPVAAVRTRGAVCLGLLMPLAVRVDPLVTELLGSLPDASSAVRESTATALAHVFWKAGDKVTTPVRARAVQVLLPYATADLMAGVEDAGEWRSAASALGAAVRRADAGSMLTGALVDREALLSASDVDRITEEDMGEESVRLDPEADGKSGLALALLRHAPAAMAADNGAALALVVHALSAGARHPHYAIRSAAARGLGFALGSACATPVESTASPSTTGRPPFAEDFSVPVVAVYSKAVPTLLPLLSSLLLDASPDVRRAAITAAGRVAALGWAVAVRHATIAPALLPALVGIMSKEAGNYVLRAVTERALVHWTQALSPQAAASASPPAPVTALLDKEAARFLGDLWRRSLQGAAEASLGADGEGDEDEDEIICARV